MAALRTLDPDTLTDLEHEIRQTRNDLAHQRDQHASHTSILHKLDAAIIANERHLARLESMRDSETA